MHANTNYSRDLLTEASWTTSRSLSTFRSNSASPDASRLALYRAINSRSSSVPCSSTLNSRWNLRFSFLKFKALKCSLNLMTDTTSQKSNTLLRSELKGMSGGLQLIAYRCPSGRTTLQCTHRWQTHTPYTYLYNNIMKTHTKYN